MDSVRAFRPGVPGIVEVFHARFTDHVYPMHAHATWTLLIVDDGAVRYDLDRHEHGALRDVVTLLPPYIPHNGRAATGDGFRKRVLYLDLDVLGEDLVGPGVDRPAWRDPALRGRIGDLHRVLDQPAEGFAAENRYALVVDRLRAHLRPVAAPRPDGRLADALRELLDSRIAGGVTLAEASALLHADPAHLVRTFTARFGMPPHRYLTSRRVDLARRLLLDGRPPVLVASDAGFYDQAHLNRHFRRIVGTTPAAFVRA